MKNVLLIVLLLLSSTVVFTQGKKITVRVGSGASGGGGTSPTKFGVAGQDATAAENRSFDGTNYDFSILNTKTLTVSSIGAIQLSTSGTYNAGFYADPTTGWAGIQSGFGTAAFGTGGFGNAYYIDAPNVPIVLSNAANGNIVLTGNPDFVEISPGKIEVGTVDFNLPSIPSSIQSNVLYYNNTNGTVSYGAAPSGGGAGGQTEVFNWKYSTNTTEGNPSNGNFRIDVDYANIATASELYLHDITSELQIDMSAMFSRMEGKWLCFIQQYNDATKNVSFQIDTDLIGPLFDNGGWWSIPVEYISSNGFALTNLSRCTFVFVNQNGSTTGGGTGVTDGDKGDVLVSGAGTTWLIENNYKTTSKGITVDGMGAVITAANTSYGFTIAPYNGTITGWTIDGNVSGSTVFDVNRAGVSIIGAGNKPTLSGASTNTASATGWTSTAVTAGDKLEFIAVSAATVSRVTVTLFITKN